MGLDPSGSAPKVTHQDFDGHKAGNVLFQDAAKQSNPFDSLGE